MLNRITSKLITAAVLFTTLSSCTYEEKTPPPVTEAPEKRIIINSSTDGPILSDDQTGEDEMDRISAATLYPAFTKDQKVSPVAKGSGDIKPLYKIDTTKKDDDLSQFYPIAENTQQIYRYTDGTETARVVQYIRTSGDETLVQIDTLKGNNNTIKIISITPDEVSEVFDIRDVFYRENFIGRYKDYRFIHLKKPLVKGNKWESDGMKSEIIDTERVIEVAGTKVRTVVVHTENEKSAFEFYYARGIGLVRTDFGVKGGKLSTAMTYKGNIEESTENYRIGFYFPEKDDLMKIEVSVDFSTNDIAKDVLSETYKKLAFDAGLTHVIPDKAILQFMYIENDMVHADLSSEFIDYINMYPEKEKIILKALASTISEYYGGKKVYLTINDQRYESQNLKIDKDTPLETCLINE